MNESLDAFFNAVEQLEKLPDNEKYPASLKYPELRFLNSNEICSVAETDDEVKEALMYALLEDVSTVHLAEMTFNTKYDFKEEEMMRFLFMSHQNILREILKESEVSCFISVKEDGQIRLSDNPVLLKEALDFIGVVVDGINAVPGEEVFKLNPNMSVSELREKALGCLPEIEMLLAEEQNANRIIPGSSTLN